MGCVNVSSLAGSAMKKLLLVCNDESFFLLHRLPEALGARDSGYEVHVATPAGSRKIEIERHGFVYHEINFTRGGCNPLTELFVILKFKKMIKEIKPEILYLMTLKPLIYGGIAARLNSVRAVVFAFYGLGYVFTNESLIAGVLKYFLSIMLKSCLKIKNKKVIFQNKTDMRIMMNIGRLRRDDCVVISGSGVDLNKYVYTIENNSRSVVLMAARLLRDKGIYEYMEAAVIVRDHFGIKAEFLIAGGEDPSNPSSINIDDVIAMCKQGYIKYLGLVPDMPELIASSNLIVLPSYREGLPRILEEAASCGRAVVTTDVPGCRDAVIEGKTGIVVPAKNSIALAFAIKELLLNNERRCLMGKMGHEHAKSNFDVTSIVSQHINTYSELLKHE